MDRVTDEGNDKNKVAKKKKNTWWEEINLSRRRTIFFYDVLWALILGSIGFVLLATYNCDVKATPHQCGPIIPLLIKYKVFINCMWIGALGGVTISMKGVYDHGNPKDPWSDAFNLWHIGRPISGAVAGLIVALLFTLMSPANGVSPLVMYGVAFIFGTQDAAFFTFLSDFAGRFVKSDKQGPVGVRINSVSPEHAGPGKILTIQGQGFEPEATVKIGDTALENYTLTPSGTTISAVIPRLTGIEPGKDKVIDVIVSNKSGSSAALVGKFTYGPQSEEPKKEAEKPK